MTEYKPITVSYITSLEKWKGIRRFAELNNIETGNIDVMISHIETCGDASLDEPARFEINDLKDLKYSIFNTNEHPCPHCVKFDSCTDCPLDNDLEVAIDPWHKVKTQFTALI